MQLRGLTWSNAILQVERLFILSTYGPGFSAIKHVFSQAGKCSTEQDYTEETRAFINDMMPKLNKVIEIIWRNFTF